MFQDKTSESSLELPSAEAFLNMTNYDHEDSQYWIGTLREAVMKATPETPTGLPQKYLVAKAQSARKDSIATPGKLRKLIIKLIKIQNHPIILGLDHLLNVSMNTTAADASKIDWAAMIANEKRLQEVELDSNSSKKVISNESFAALNEESFFRGTLSARSTSICRISSDEDRTRNEKFLDFTNPPGPNFSSLRDTTTASSASLSSLLPEQAFQIGKANILDFNDHDLT